MKTPQDKDESDTIPNGAAPPLITTTSPKSNNKISAKQLLAFLFSFAIGLVVGGYATSSLLESEYRTVISTLISNHQNSISDTKLEHNECHRDLLEAKEAYSRSTSQYGDTTCHEKLQSIQSQRRHEELSCHQEMEQEIMWSHKAYQDSTAALRKASDKLMETKERSIALSDELQRTKTQLELVTSNLQQTNDHYTKEQIQRKELEAEWDFAKSQFEEMQTLFLSLEKEIERRDLERAHCDKSHRDMIQCQQSLRKTLEGETDGCTTSLELASHDKKELNSQITTLKREHDSVNRRSNLLETQLEGANALVKEFEIERDGLRDEIQKMQSIMSERDRLSVLDRYGSGPHRVQLTIQLPTNPPQEDNLILDLAPLSLMPHTIKSFLDMIERETFIDGTFMLAKSHILLGGPVDYHDDENNSELSGRIAEDGYADGVLLMNEYTSEYPHVEGTIGFTASHPGPVFYINLVDNSEKHGDLRDPCFGKFVKGFDLIQRIAKMPKEEENGVFDLPIYIVRAEIVD